MRNLALVSAAAFLLINLALASTAQAAGCGTAEVVKGKVEVTRKGAAAAPLAQGGKVCAGDTVTTAAESRAKLVMEDSNVLNVNPSSAFKIEAYENDPASAKKKVLLNVMYGKMRATVNQKYDGKSSSGDPQTFQVKTKSAVAGVRGTDFLTSFSPANNKMEVVTFEGKVEVGQAGPGGSIQNSVSVGAGQKTEAAPGQPPAPPKPVPAGELKSLEKSSDAGPAPQANENAAGAGPDKDKKDEKKEDKKDAKQEQKQDEKKQEDKKDAKQDEKKDSKQAGKDDKKDDKKDAKQDEKKDPKQAGKDDKKDAKQDDKKGDKQAGDRKGSEGGDKSAGGTAAPAPGGTAAAGGDMPAAEGGDRAPSSTTTASQPAPGTAPAPLAPAPMLGGSTLPPPPPAPTFGAIIGGLPPLPPVLPTIPVIYQPPTCDFCNTAIQTGPAKVNIKIVIPQ